MISEKKFTMQNQEISTEKDHQYTGLQRFGRLS